MEWWGYLLLVFGYANIGIAVWLGQLVRLKNKEGVGRDVVFLSLVLCLAFWPGVVLFEICRELAS